MGFFGEIRFIFKPYKKSLVLILSLMSALFLRAGLWLSLLVAVLAVLVRFQHPLQEIFLSEAPSQTFCYSGGITTKFSTNTKASCFTVKDGVVVDILVPGSEPPTVEFQQGHAIPGLWDGVKWTTFIQRDFMIQFLISY